MKYAIQKSSLACTAIVLMIMFPQVLIGQDAPGSTVVRPATPSTDTVSPATPPAPAATPTRPAENVRVVTFRLRNGSVVSGRIVNDDRLQITVAQLVESRIVNTTFPRTDIELRSINTRSITAYQYWIETGEYFESKTWDFVNDADDFAQALRSFQNARQMAVDAAGTQGRQALDAADRITKLEESRSRWMEIMRPRAEMAEMELVGTLEERLSTMQQTIDDNNRQIQQLALVRRQLEERITAIDRSTSIRMDRMYDDIRRNYEIMFDLHPDYRRKYNIVIPGTRIEP